MGENDEIKTVDAVVADEQRNQFDPLATQFTPDGKFAPGNTLGKSNIGPRQPSRRQQYINAFHRAISHDEMEVLAKAMCVLAAQGDVQAARLVCDYTLGKPVQSVEVETNGTVSHGVLQVNFVRPDAT